MLTRLALPDARMPVLLSAHAADLVAQDAAALLRYCEGHAELATVAGVAATLAQTRRIRKYRTVIRAGDHDELCGGLRAVRDGGEHPLVHRSDSTAAPALAFVLPGQGGQWAGMGASPYRHLTEYAEEADRCAEAFVAHGVRSPLDYLVAAGEFGPVEAGATQVDIQGAQFIHSVALARVWQSHGVAPALTVGHSLGEIAAAYLAGMVGRADAVAAVIGRANAVQQLRGRYGMAVLGISAEQACRLIEDTAGWLELSAVNAGASVVVSGDRAAVAAIAATVEGRGQFARELTVDYPGHTSALEVPAAAMREQLPDIAFGAGRIPFVAASTGAPVSAGTGFAEFWRRNLRDTVRFDRAVRCAVDLGARTFVELSAHPALQFALADLTDGLAGEGVTIVGSGRRDEAAGAELTELSAAIAAVAITDPAYRWHELTAPVRVLPDFPNAPMRAERLWIAPDRPAAPGAALTTMVERWESADLPPTGGAERPRSVAVVDMLTPTELAEPLRAALDRHPGVTAAPAEDAELLIVLAPALDHPDAARAAEDITDLVRSGLLDYTDGIGQRCRQVCLVTVRGEQVRPGEPVALPAQAALAAMHRTIGFEHADQVFRHVDLPSWQPGDDVLAATIDVLCGDIGEAALRAVGARVRCYRRVLADVPAAPAWSSDSAVLAQRLDNVVITGGAGAIGLHYARYLAERGARRIVLLSRRGADPAILAKLNEFPHTEVLAPPCDITDADQLSRVAAEFAGGAPSLVVHAAAVATLGSGDGFTAAEFTDTFGAKVIGLARFTQHWPHDADTRILLCSSVSGVWGGRGHPAYPAANRMLDVLAGQLRAKGQHCVSVRWGLWRVDGIADATEMVQIARSGLVPMAPAAAIAASLAEHRIDPMVLAADAERLRVFIDSQQSGSAEESPPDAADSGRTAVLAAVDAVRTELAAVLRAPSADQIDLDATLFDLGLDSLLALDLRKRLKRVTGATVPLAKLLGGITGTALVAEIDSAAAPQKTQKVDTSREANR